MYDKELKYNFYNILAVKSGVDQGLHFVYEGQPNEPNIVLGDNNDLKKYVCKNLYVFSNQDEADGEMIIEHECTCNYGKKIYLRILLNTERMMPSNEIDKLFEKKHVEIDLNNVLQDEDDCVYTETHDGILITFKHPVNVHSKFKDLVKNPIFSSKPSSLYEGFEAVAVPDENGDFRTDDNGNLIYDVSGDSYMECDNLPIDAPIVPTEVNDQYNRRVADVLAMTSIAIFFVIVLALWYSMNSIYRIILAGLAISSYGYHGIDDLIKNVNFFEGIGFIILIVIASILPKIAGVTNEDFVAMLMYSIGIMVFLMVFSIIAKIQKQSIEFFGIPTGKRGTTADQADEVKKAWHDATWILDLIGWIFGKTSNNVVPSTPP
jgi:hypothetical protein